MKLQHSLSSLIVFSNLLFLQEINSRSIRLPASSKRLVSSGKKSGRLVAKNALNDVSIDDLVEKMMRKIVEEKIEGLLEKGLRGPMGPRGQIGYRGPQGLPGLQGLPGESCQCEDKAQQEKIKNISENAKKFANNNKDKLMMQDQSISSNSKAKIAVDEIKNMDYYGDYYNYGSNGLRNEFDEDFPQKEISLGNNFVYEVEEYPNLYNDVLNIE